MLIEVDLDDTYHNPDISFDENKTGSSTPKSRRDSFGPKIKLSAPKLALNRCINTHNFSRYQQNKPSYNHINGVCKTPGER